MLQIVSRLNTEQFDTKIDKTLPFLDFRILFDGAPHWTKFEKPMKQHGKNSWNQF